MHLRIETKDIPAKEVLKTGLKQLQEVMDHVSKTFEVTTPYEHQIAELRHSYMICLLYR